jgi:ketol-acid reductoisomerase
MKQTPKEKGMDYLRMRGILSSNAKWNKAIEDGINIALKSQAKEIFQDINEGYFIKCMESKGWDAKRDYAILLEHLIKLQHKWCNKQ